MAIFLAASLISFLIVTFAIAVSPSKFTQQTSFKQRSLTIPRIGRLELDARATLLLRRILIGFMLLTALLFSWLLLGGELAWRSHRNLPNLVFGLIFGPIFAVWIGSLIKTEDARFTLAHGISGSVLLVLFIVGLLGAEAARLAEFYSRRITKIGLGGTELTFSGLAPGRSAESDQFAAKPPPGYKSGIGSLDELPGLQNLANLDGLMDRDCSVVALVPHSAKDCQPPAADAPAAPGNQRRRWTSQVGADFARSTISGYARCLGGLYVQTLDDGVVTSRLEPFADTFRELMAATLDTGFPQRAFNTHINASRELLTYLWPAFLTPDVADNAELRASCALLLVSFCRPYELPQNSPSSPESAQARAVAWINSADARPVLDTCSKSLRRVPDAATQQRLSKLFEEFYKEEKETGFRSRPYVAIAVASLLVQLERHEAALAVLDQWIRQYEAQHGLGLQETIEPGNAHKVWYAIRARSVLYIYTDRWLAELDTAAPGVLRDMHLSNLQDYLRLLKLFPPAASMIARLNVQKYDLDRDGYRMIGTDMPGCDEQSDAGIILTHLATGNLFAYHALRHRKFDERYEAVVRRIVRDSMNADMSCIAATYSLADAAAFRSEALVLQAEILIADAAKKKSQDKTEEAEALLRKAQAAIKLALQIVHEGATSDRDKKKSATKFSERITSTKALIAEETAERTGDAIQRAIDNLN